MVEMHETDTQLTLILSGELTIQNAQVFKAALLDGLQRGKALALDLAQVSELDSAGAQLLYYAKQYALAHDLDLQLRYHSAAVIEVFELYRLAPCFGDSMVLHAASA